MYAAFFCMISNGLCATAYCIDRFVRALRRNPIFRLENESLRKKFLPRHFNRNARKVYTDR